MTLIYDGFENIFMNMYMEPNTKTPCLQMKEVIKDLKKRFPFFASLLCVSILVFYSIIEEQISMLRILIQFDQQ